jgi:hypothetical protein
MKPPEENILFRVSDALLCPFMWILGGLVFPVQETHKWHVKRWDWKKGRGLPVKGTDSKARFSHGSFPGLFHMPLIGGLTKYVVIEAEKFDKFWYVGWDDSIHSLKIKQKRIKLLVGKSGSYNAFGLGDNGSELKLKVVGYGKLGDQKYKGIRLF